MSKGLYSIAIKVHLYIHYVARAKSLHLRIVVQNYSAAANAKLDSIRDG